MRRTLLSLGIAVALLAVGPPMGHAIVQPGQPAPGFTKTELGTGQTRTLASWPNKVLVLFVMGWL